METFGQQELGEGELAQLARARVDRKTQRREQLVEVTLGVAGLPREVGSSGGVQRYDLLEPENRRLALFSCYLVDGSAMAKHIAKFGKLAELCR